MYNYNFEESAWVQSQTYIRMGAYPFTEVWRCGAASGSPIPLLYLLPPDPHCQEHSPPPLIAPNPL